MGPHRDLGRLLLMAIVFLMPVYVMVANGLKDAPNVSLSTMWLPPTQVTTQNGFVGAWNGSGQTC